MKARLFAHEDTEPHSQGERETLVVRIAKPEGYADAGFLDVECEGSEHAHPVRRDGVFVLHDVQVPISEAFHQHFNYASMGNGNVGVGCLGGRQVAQFLAADKLRAHVMREDSFCIHDTSFL
jgi:hypothetical protein